MDITQEYVDSLKVNEVRIMEAVASALAVQTRQVSAVVGLVAEGCTVPFIARYRKEAHGNLDEVQVRECEKRFAQGKALEERRLEAVRLIHGQGKLDEALLGNLMAASTMAEIEELYAPYKRKRKTRGMIALERGLGPLADLMLVLADSPLEAKAASFVREDAENPELSVKDAAEALQGAMDVLAERASQDAENRRIVKAFYLSDAKLVVQGVGGEEKRAGSVYQMYWDYSEPLSAVKPHRLMAIVRGEREGELETRVETDEATSVKLLSSRLVFANSYHPRAVEDALRRLLSPSVIREIRSEAMEAAEAQGIGVFSANLRNLLMQPPIKGTRVLGMDPGLRTGTKCAALDETGKFLGDFLVRQEKPAEAKALIAAAIRKWDLKLVAVGNGTGSQEARAIVVELIAESFPDLAFTVVDEDGASVYSASDIAREEFPELDLTVRGAISIGRRLQDPLAELVKIDPRSIGVGQYQHDLDQKALSDALDETVGSVVNAVGVNLNTASVALLKYVSGITSSTARKIVSHRDGKGALATREDILGIPGMGPKTYEQCAGFLKIPQSPEPLDNTWVHPENYPLARELRASVLGGKDPTRAEREELKARFSVGDSTLDDIIAELKKPNRDPREGYPKPVLQKELLSFEDLREGVMVTGKVKNVVDFGAFVDLGLKETALIHVSEMGDRFIRDPREALKVGDVKEFRVISIDPVRKRIGLSLRSADARPRGSAPSRNAGSSRNETQASKSSGSSGKSYGGRDGKARAEREDDGTTYNPFAALLKK